MRPIDPNNDWPEVDLMALVRSPPPALENWLAASPRRAWSKQGILLARQRQRPTPEAAVLNLPPDSPTEAVWSVDLITSRLATRFIAPDGVLIDAVAWANKDVSITWRLPHELKTALGLPEAVVTTTSSLEALTAYNLATELEGTASPVEAFAKLLASGGAKSAQVTKLKDRADAGAAKAKKKAAATDAAIAKKIWAAAPRGRPVPAAIKTVLASEGLGPFDASIATLARRVTALIPTEGKSVPVGAPRLGGQPDLPLKTGWPEIDGQLLTFVLQVQAEDALLSLFVGRNETTTEVEHQLLAVKPTSLQRRPVPTNAVWRDQDLGLLEPVPLEAREGWALPPIGSDEHVALCERHPELRDLEESYRRAVNALVPADASQVFGFAAQSSLERERKKDRPLLKVTSNTRAKLSFWDHGTLDVFSPANAFFGRGVVRDTFAAILTS